MERNDYLENLTEWDEIEKEFFTSEEIAASDLRVQLMIEISEARHKNRITQKKLEEMTGIKQPVIARMETGKTSPRLDTVMKVLAALGKKLVITDL